ncbi:MAG: VOC family protein [Planctomycetaceae bacterium]|nr:VOC family protein [Planctomycetaceae bacterium]
MTPAKVTTCLWFNATALDAATFYTSLFPVSSIDSVTPGPTGDPLAVSFRLAGTPFLALNGGPAFQLTEAVSLSVNCKDQLEVDLLWATLTEGGEESRCGWLKDRFGLSWQIVPEVLPQLLSDPHRGAAVMQTLLQMSKIEIETLQAASDAA